MDTVGTDMSITEAHLAIEEVDAASQLAAQALDDTHPAVPSTSVDAQVIGAVSADSADILRNKAKRQRMKGIENLARRHDGVASMVVTVKLFERVVASAFERYFATIETGIHVINKSGAMFVGVKAAAQIEESIIERIDAMEVRIKAEIARLKVSMDVHQSREDWIVPSYTKPAAEHEVQLRTRLANRVLAIFRSQDEFIVALNQLSWNDEADADAIEMEELNIKKELRGLAQFIQRTLRGMRNRVTVKEVAVDAETQQAGAGPEVIEQLAA